MGSAADETLFFGAFGYVHFFLRAPAHVSHGDGGGNIAGLWFVDAVNQIVKGNVSSVESFKPNQSCPDYFCWRSSTRARPGPRVTVMTKSDTLKCLTMLRGGFRPIGPWSACTTATRNTYLSDAATLLVQQGFREIHCCFCRGGLWDAITPKGKGELPGGTKYTG